MTFPEGAVTPIHLLLLPPAPWPASYNVLRAVYQDPLSAVLKQLAYETRSATIGAKLDIALPVPYLYENRVKQRRKLFSPIQTLIAGVYKLICVIAAKERIDIEDAEGIDVRVLLLAHPRLDNERQAAQASPVEGDSIGPVIDLVILAHSERPWRCVFSVDTEECEGILRAFLINQDRQMKIQKVPGGASRGSTEHPESLEEVEADDDQEGSHTSVAVGGTWDHIHIGHKLLLTMFAFMLPGLDDASEDERSLTIGITGDELLKNKKLAELLESWSDRQRSASAFLQAIMDFRTPADTNLGMKTLSEAGPNGHALHVKLGRNLVMKFVEISDPYGPTITDKSISALVLSAETRAGGKAVNEKRMEKEWPALEVFEVNVLDADGESTERSVDESFQNKLSSTRIRQSISDKAKRRSKV